MNQIEQKLTTQRCRVRELDIVPGILSPGPTNSIIDVRDVRVGHLTVIEGDDIRTGASAILPHAGNLFQEKVPAGVAVANGFGKLIGSTQIQELGEIETPIVLTNTLAAPRAADAILDWVLAQPGNEEVRSINPVVGETNDGYLNHIARRVLTPDMIRHCIEQADTSHVAEGCVGAGTGTVAFGWKGGIGSSSRRLPDKFGAYTVGALVQSNYGGVLQIAGLPVGQMLGQYYLREESAEQPVDGSIMMILATDAPLSNRNLTRLARRAFAGLARTGASMSNGSGDYALAFSTAEAVRRTPERRRQIVLLPELPNEQMSPLFQAAIEATEEAIYNSLCMATTITGYQGRSVKALPLEELRALLRPRF